MLSTIYVYLVPAVVMVFNVIPIDGLLSDHYCEFKNQTTPSKFTVNIYSFTVCINTPI